MDPETALGFVKHGATLLLLDVPPHTLVGIDTQMFSVGPAFKGIKMIPPGPHFLYYSPSNREGNEFSPIIGFFVDASPSEIGSCFEQLYIAPKAAMFAVVIGAAMFAVVIVRQWDQQEERLVKLSEDEEERYSQAVKSLEFDRQLGPYTLSQYGDWKRLSNYITKSTIECIEPIGGEITVACESEIVANIPSTPTERALAEQLKNGKFSRSVDKSQRRGSYYTPIPRVIKNKAIHGQELTSLNLDKTQLLESILINHYGGSEDLILGELQFAFIAFLMGQSLEAFLQWKSLVSLFLGCTEAFIKVIYYQLKYGFQKEHTSTGGAEKGTLTLLDESWLSDSFLHHLCKDFFSLVLEAPVVNGDLLSWTRKFKELLEDTLGWDFQQKNAVDGMYCEEDDELATHCRGTHTNVCCGSCLQQVFSLDQHVHFYHSSDLAILRALREDERRQNASLAPKTSTRVMKAMCGVSFSGLAPGWTDQVPDDRSIDQSA
ncbi:hypothetical protein TEA_023236 [Camellia sinensis var. sinensis]|uniref:AAR2 splicing factor homolog n=1 Tax=Camellia sinensis var. sinensis TaxID=542762 RepID=A0A4S4DKB3_CAMSN|nr:hypothetical protein TEA_023236 [Camellia sinensis var. sinensis]